MNKKSLPPKKADKSTNNKVETKTSPASLSEDRKKTKDQLIEELQKLRRKVTRIEKTKVKLTQHETLLHESEERYRNLYERAPLGYQSLDENGCFKEVNEAWLKILGHKKEDVIGKWFGDFLPEEYKDVFKSNFSRFKSRGSVSGVEFEMLRKDGSTIIVSFDGKIGKDMEGNFLQMHCILQDITEQKRIEEALRESEEKFKMFANLLPVGVYMTDKDGKCTYVNKKWLDMAGITFEDAMGDGWANGIHPDDRKQVFENWNNMVESSGEWGFEYRFHNNQSKLDTLVYATAIKVFDSKGNVNAFIGANTDLTERRKTEEIIEISESRLRKAQDIAGLGFWDLDLITGELVWSDVIYTHIGFKPHEIVPSYEIFKERLHPDDRDYAQKHVDAALNDDVPYNIDMRYLLPTGEIHYVNAQGEVTRDENGKAIRFFGTQINITERKKTEEALRISEAALIKAQEIGHIGSWHLDIEKNILTWSDEEYRIFGLTPQEFGATYEAFLEAVHPDDKEMVNKTYTDAIKNHTPYECVHRVLRPDGEIRTVLEKSEDIVDKNGKTIHSIGMTLDITEQKRMEAEAIKAQKLESLGVLAGGIAHDFNNLLTAIYGNVSLAKLTTDAGSPTYHKLRDIEKALAMTKDLTHQLLTFSKGGAPVMKSTNIASLIEDTVKFCLSGTSVEASISIADNLKEVNVDEGQISQVIQNLVINANDAMLDGGKLSVKAKNLRLGDSKVPNLSAGEYVAIHIRDTGHGIPEEHLDKIFDPFFTTKDSGSGLGLASSYSIIKKHDGALTVYSKEGNGTEFRIYLPVKDKESEAEELDASIIRGQGRILVMDDEELIRTISRELLKSLGYTIELTSNGEETIEKYIEALEKGKPFDAVILDLTVKGGMGGRRTIEKLMEIDSNVKAIVSSGYEAGETISNYRDFGFKAELLKPYDVERLSQVLHQVING